jgi:riboflavin biosynthesis pyrimidine reductase
VILTRVHPAPAVPIDLSDGDARERLSEWYRPPTAAWIRLNLVASLSGSAAGSDGTSETLTNAADRTLLGVIRSLSDVVLVGAASVRAEGYFVPRTAALAVVTASGDLTGHRITSSSTRGPIVVICPKSAVDTARATITDSTVRILPVPDADGRITAADIVAALHGEGFASIVCEGGPALAAHLVVGGVVDEVCLTTSPIMNGARLPLLGDDTFPPQQVALEQLMVDDASGVYARWRVTGVTGD